MRKITQQAVESFFGNDEFKQGNTAVYYSAMTKDGQYPKGDHFKVMALDGNEIARVDSATGIVEVNNCGWLTPTTKERLNGIGAGISQVNFKWYLSDGSQMQKNKWVRIGLVFPKQ